MKKQITWVLAGAGSFFISLAVLAPLPVLVQQIIRVAPEMQFAGVSGTVWKGEIQRLTTPQWRIDDLYWTFRPMWLLQGYLGADVNAQVQQSVQVTGECGVSLFNNLKCEPLNLDAAAGDVAAQVPAVQEFNVQLAGALQGRFEQIFWNRDTVPVASGDVTWRDAVVQAPIAGELNLGGEYRAQIREAEQAEQALDIALESRESALVLDGTIAVMEDGRYNFEAFLKPSGEAPANIANVLSLLGSPQSDGSVRLGEEGKLPGFASESVAD